MENDDVISDDRQIAEISNNYFVTVTETLGIADNLDNVRSAEGIIDPVEKAIEKYANHPSIKTILTRFPVVAGFSFEHVTVSKIETEIKNLNSDKATTFVISHQSYSRLIQTSALNPCKKFSTNV